MGEAKRRQEYYQQQPHQRLGDAPVEAAYRDKMVAVVQAIDELFNGKAPDKQVGFVLMTFPYGDTAGRCNYMSNGADRRDVVNLMKEMIARFEGQPELSGTA
jgi:hypothetical protein